jgi:hypothetical protein
MKRAERPKDVAFACLSLHAHPFFVNQTRSLNRKTAKYFSCWFSRKCELSNQVGIGLANKQLGRGYEKWIETQPNQHSLAGL